MPEKDNVWYCTDDCGPGYKYRKNCPYHYGMSLQCLGLMDYNDGRDEIYANDFCGAAGGHRQLTLREVPKYAEKQE